MTGDRGRHAGPLRLVVEVLHRHIVATIVLVPLAFAGPAAAQAPNDAHWERQWGPQQVRAPEAWATSRGDGATIAIVDTGIDLEHPDLAERIVGGATFVCPSGVSMCGDGDWASGADSPGSWAAHGTHVAGIAAATADNGIGVAGVAPEARLLAVKAVRSNGSMSAHQLARAFRWAADNGADVINLSNGASQPAVLFEATGNRSAAEVADAIAYARSRGAVVVAVAGNQAGLPCSHPGWVEGVVCAAATDGTEARAWYSNFALKPDLNVVAAPGGNGLGANYETGKVVLGLDDELGPGPGNPCRGDVISTVPIVSADELSACERAEDTPGYGFFGGTSMAAPHVAGVAALLASQGRDAEEIVRVLKATARTPHSDARGIFDPLYGYGIVDAQAAVAAPLGDADASTRPTTRARGCTPVACDSSGAGRAAGRAHAAGVAARHGGSAG